MSPSTSKILFFCSLLSFAFSASAADKKKEETPNIPLYQGIQIGVDFISPVKCLFSDTYGAGIKADVNLKNKYFPTIELGFDNFNKTSDAGIHYTSSGQYFKIGVNKALSYKGSKAENMFFAGVHYGFSAFSYDLKDLTYAQNYWGNDVTFFKDEKAAVGWIELVTGVRVQLFGPVSMGWTAQFKSTLHVSNGKNSIPAFIPGYGSNVKPNAEMAFHIYYKLPF